MGILATPFGRGVSGFLFVHFAQPPQSKELVTQPKPSVLTMFETGRHRSCGFRTVQPNFISLTFVSIWNVIQAAFVAHPWTAPALSLLGRLIRLLGLQVHLQEVICGELPWTYNVLGAGADTPDYSRAYLKLTHASSIDYTTDSVGLYTALRADSKLDQDFALRSTK